MYVQFKSGVKSVTWIVPGGAPEAWTPRSDACGEDPRETTKPSAPPLCDVSYAPGVVGKSGEVVYPVTVRMPGDCAPTAADPVLFHVTAADLPGINDCTTTAECQQVTAVDGSGLPRELALEIAGANPFRGATSLSYAIPRRAEVRIDVYDASGRRVRTLVQGAREAGRYVTSLDVRERGQAALDAGVYFVSLSASGEKRTKTVIALR